MNPPEDFTPLFRSSPFLELLGPIYNESTDSGIVIGFYAQPKHCNTRGIVHGGVLSSLADVALGYNAAFSGENTVPLVTASLTIYYAGSAKQGQWITISSDVQKVGKTMAFANCYFLANDIRIARASGVFTVLNK